MIDFTKSEKRELRRLAGEAYKGEMEKEIAKVEAAFKAWREGKLNVFDIDEQIHAYYSGPRKQLYGFYQMRNQPEAAVARGIVTGLIDPGQVPTEIKAKIEHMTNFAPAKFLLISNF